MSPILFALFRALRFAKKKGRKEYKIYFCKSTVVFSPTPTLPTCLSPFLSYKTKDSPILLE